MKKTILIVACVLLTILCLTPSRIYLDDGGTVIYKAILYQVENVHSIHSENTDEYLEGTIVKIIGIEVYNDVR
ncbi:MAG: hypothetical protein IKL13_03230 [Clostridia bacterium]|nr:hypothetical protein [Clostridia bacterium]